MNGHRDDVVTISRPLWDAIAASLLIAGRTLTLVPVEIIELTDAQLDELTRSGVDSS